MPSFQQEALRNSLTELLREQEETKAMVQELRTEIIQVRLVANDVSFV